MGEDSVRLDRWLWAARFYKTRGLARDACVGGKVDAIILGPVGGLVSPRVPDEPEVQLFVALAGPIVHLTLVVLAAVGLALAGVTNILALLHPLSLNLVDDETTSWLLFGKLTLWLNWVLLL